MRGFYELTSAVYHRVLVTARMVVPCASHGFIVISQYHYQPWRVHEIGATAWLRSFYGSLKDGTLSEDFPYVRFDTNDRSWLRLQSYGVSYSYTFSIRHDYRVSCIEYRASTM